jgi:hypothetical protein
MTVSAVCPVCSNESCPDWDAMRTQTWHRPPKKFVPLRPVPAGEMRPCGENVSGTIREFFVNPADVDDLVANGVRVREYGRPIRFRCELTATPYYSNGDVQVRLIEVSEPEAESDAA